MSLPAGLHGPSSDGFTRSSRFSPPERRGLGGNLRQPHSVSALRSLRQALGSLGPFAASLRRPRGMSPRSLSKPDLLLPSLSEPEPCAVRVRFLLARVGALPFRSKCRHPPVSGSPAGPCCLRSFRRTRPFPAHPREGVLSPVTFERVEQGSPFKDRLCGASGGHLLR